MLYVNTYFHWTWIFVWLWFVLKGCILHRVDRFVCFCIIKSKIMSVGIIHKYFVIEKQTMCISTQSYTKEISKVCYCVTPLIIKLNVKILTNIPYNLSIWSMILVCIVQVVKRQFMFQLFVHMFIFHCFVPQKRKYSRAYNLILCLLS